MVARVGVREHPVPVQEPGKLQRVDTVEKLEFLR